MSKLYGKASKGYHFESLVDGKERTAGKADSKLRTHHNSVKKKIATSRMQVTFYRDNGSRAKVDYEKEGVMGKISS